MNFCANVFYWYSSLLSTVINVKQAGELMDLERKTLDAFKIGCSSLTEISIPASVTSIEDDAFFYCSNLKFVDFWGTKEPDYGENVFGRSSVTTVIVSRDYNGDTFCGLPVIKNLRDFSEDWFVRVGVQALQLIDYIESHDINNLGKEQIQLLLKDLNRVLKQVKEDANRNLYLSGKWQGKDNTILHDDIVRLQKFKENLEG